MLGRDICLFCWTFIISCNGQYNIPPLKIEPLTPRGLRVSITDSPGVQIFQFHGRINRPISNVEPGELTTSIHRPANSRWVFYDPDVKLEIGDIIYYYVFVQHDRLGYRKDDQMFKVIELFPYNYQPNCEISGTTINGGETVCQGSIIFQDDFDDTCIDTNKWIVEHRIPTYTGPDYEFNSYQNIDQTRYQASSKLYLQPQLLNTEDIRGTLDLKTGCTSTELLQCFYKQQIVYLLPPVKSAKVVSKFSFKYGKVEVRAKLPQGDWIYPQLSLEPKPPNDVPEKLWIAYSRGNDKLTDDNGNDLGSRLLYGGAVLIPEEPLKSVGLLTKKAKTPYFHEMHTYTLLWRPENITLYVDSLIYGTINISVLKQFLNGTPFDYELHLAFGVGVGGNNDFPDNFKSGKYAKPWKNNDRDSLKKFFDSRHLWANTWQGDKTALQIDYVKIWAL